MAMSGNNVWHIHILHKNVYQTSIKVVNEIIAWQNCFMKASHAQRILDQL